MFLFYFQHRARSTTTPPVAHIFTPRKYECLDSGKIPEGAESTGTLGIKRSKNTERERTVTWYFNCSGTSLWKISSKTPPLEKEILKIAPPSCIYSTGDANGSKTSIKQGAFHLCLTQISTAWENMPSFSGLLGWCHAARVKCCCTGVKQLQISCVCVQECCAFVLPLTNRPFFQAT